MKLRATRDRMVALPMTPIQYVMVGIILSFLGVALFGGSLFLGRSMVEQQKIANSQRMAAASQCVQALAEMEFETRFDQDRKRISARLEGLDGAALKMGKASAAAILCPGWKLSRFCMGQNCDFPNSLWLELRPK